MRFSLLCLQLVTLTTTTLAYNCNSYVFPLNGSWIPSQNISNVDINDKFVDVNPEGMGSAHIWGNPGGPVPWERDKNNLFTIKYCFIRDDDREYIGDTFEAAIKELWNEVGQAGPRSGHGLAMREVLDEDGDPMYCMDSTQEDKCNKKVPCDTLLIEYTGGTEKSCSSTIGLQRTNPPTHSNMRLSIDAPHLIQDTMHELGHVFGKSNWLILLHPLLPRPEMRCRLTQGMEHQHQRADRDKYIQVLYRNLRDFRSCYQKAKIQEPDITEDELCLDYKKAARYGCGCREYIKGVSINGETIKAGNKEFD